MVEYQNILGLLEAHVELQPLLLKSHDRLKDLLFLDIALDSTVRTTVERGYEELNNVEPEVQKLQKELQEEIDLHFALANTVAQTSTPLSDSPSQIPTKAQELLSNKDVLEITVLKLEEELIALHFLLSQERNERM
ncbi:alpha-glucan water dikinase, chloroplastic-like isoform X2 [Magnolia sinica]|uniref:alpha-glucan water dikinase, chloroplastic-like isoform X2 n=1 Tax=Magnolia sinica TaxID=86752 RepID=UPI00265831F8|nr:alpha-glucan water dikinase, chloroplastic-like isoform X2 [Magnolia sinica]